MGIYGLLCRLADVRRDWHSDQERTWPQWFRIRSAYLYASTDRCVAALAARYLDRSIRRPDRDVHSACGLRRTRLVVQLRRQTLAIPRARPGTWCGGRLFCRWHTICGALLSQGAPWFRNGRVRRRNDRRGDQHVCRPGAARSLWLAGCPEILCRRTIAHGGHLLVLFGARRLRARQERRFAAAAIERVQGPTCLEILSVLFDRFRGFHRVISLDAAILRAGVWAEHLGSRAVRRFFLAARRCFAGCRRLAGRSLWRPQRDMVGAVGGLD